MRNLPTYKGFVNEQRLFEAKYEKINIFDVDDTLVVTDSKIKVTDNKTGKVYELTPKEFNEYETKKHHELDFSDFSDLNILKAGKIIDWVFDILKATMKKGKRELFLRLIPKSNLGKRKPVFRSLRGKLKRGE